MIKHERQRDYLKRKKNYYKRKKLSNEINNLKHNLHQKAKRDKKVIKQYQQVGKQQKKF